MDSIDSFKAAQRAAWTRFVPLQAHTTEPAAQLVKFAGIERGQRVLDVACGTGVVAITAARLGAHVTGVDLTPELVVEARDNARIAGMTVDWYEGDVEALAFEQDVFDVVISQYGHLFAPRPDVAIGEMLRVLKPGGVIAFSTWPPELYVGRLLALAARYMPSPPAGVSPPPQWGDPHIIRERLGTRVRDVRFDRASMRVPALSVQHQRELFERTSGPVSRLVETLATSDLARLDAFRAEAEALMSEYFADNVLRQDYLMTRAVKV